MKKLYYIIPLGIAILTTMTIIAFRVHPQKLTSRPADSGKNLADYYTEAQGFKKSSAIVQDSTVTFLAVGDILLSRNIAATIKAKNDALHPFRGLDELLRSTDFNFGNLETPFSKSDAFTARNTLVFNAPKANVAGLKEYNFKVLNLANNHAYDQGLDGIVTTKKILDDNGILHMGTGKDLEEAWQPVIIEKNGIKIGFIGASYSSVNDGGRTTNSYVARIEDTNRLESNVKSLKSHVDFVMVTMHAGTEYTAKPNAGRIAFAHAAIDAGADIVIGTHPHWVQNKELYCPDPPLPPLGEGGAASTTDEGVRSIFVDSHELVGSHRDNCKPIYYSLGNFIFDQSWSEETKKGLALKITVSKSLGFCHSGFNKSASDAGNPESMNLKANSSACADNLQGSKFSPTLSIQEIPIYIKENCCPIIDVKNSGGLM